MSIQPINDSQAWTQFVNAAKAARERNPVLAQTPVKKPAVAEGSAFAGYLKTLSAVRTTAEVSPVQGSGAGRQVLGTRFDAYA